MAKVESAQVPTAKDALRQSPRDVAMRTGDVRIALSSGCAAILLSMELLVACENSAIGASVGKMDSIDLVGSQCYWFEATVRQSVVASNEDDLDVIRPGH